uniref:pyridoxal kinase n=1 Tax=Roseovarius indicus TaxID=540747 RepID=UPI003B519983
MARILILSSVVAMGHVGLSAGQPVCQRLGYDVTGVPTTVLSNHPAWPHVAGAAVDPGQIGAMVAALEANGWLADHEAVLIGYMPSAAHVEVAVDLIRRVRAVAPGARVVVDPILGDRPKGLYVPEDVAVAVRDRLVPMADVATPNLFELGWLTGRDCSDVDGATKAARALGVPVVHVTSPPLREPETGVLSVASAGVELYRSARAPDVPHGIGDVFAALIAAGLPVAQALGHVAALARASQGRAHLAIVAGAAEWAAAGPVASEKV